jgi:hypothetical protein
MFKQVVDKGHLSEQGILRAEVCYRTFRLVERTCE